MPAVNSKYLEKYKEVSDTPLGSGAFSTVHLVVSRLDGNKYAAKIAKQNGNRAEKTFKDEIKILSNLKPNEFLVNMFECFPKTPYVIVLDLVSGGELFDEIVKRGKYNEKDSKKAARQLLMAIDALHKQGIAHRDLKPENILLDENWDIKVTDFGLAKTFDKPRGRKTFRQYCGTPEYMAKEMHVYKRDKVKYDETVDEYAAGIILYRKNQLTKKINLA